VCAYIHRGKCSYVYEFLCLYCVSKKNDRHTFLVGIGVILWTILLSHNDVVFDKIPISSSMYVISKETHWTRT
jgi:hypothetical protein